MGERFHDGSVLDVDPDEVGDVVIITLTNPAGHISSCTMNRKDIYRVIAKFTRNLGYLDDRKERRK